jgi:hypothetical protein
MGITGFYVDYKIIKENVIRKIIPKKQLISRFSQFSSVQKASYFGVCILSQWTALFLNLPTHAEITFVNILTNIYINHPSCIGILSLNRYFIAYFTYKIYCLTSHDIDKNGRDCPCLKNMDSSLEPDSGGPEQPNRCTTIMTKYIF